MTSSHLWPRQLRNEQPALFRIRYEQPWGRLGEKDVRKTGEVEC